MQELTQSKLTPVRNNIIIALSDLVVVHTSLVDPYIPRLAECLRDPNDLIRIQTLGLLSNLLHRDYLKCRSILFYALCTCLIDKSDRVASMAASAIRPRKAFADSKGCVSVQDSLAYAKFVDMVFVLNDFQELPKSFSYDLEVDVLLKRKNAIKLHMSGSSEDAINKRYRLYSALISQMTPEQKFGIVARLCQDILGGIVDGNFDLEACGDVLQDTFMILQMPEILEIWQSKKASCSESSDLLFDKFADTSVEATAKEVSTKIVAQMINKHVVDSILPILLDLRTQLLEKRHPLYEDMMRTTAAMLQQHAEEINDLLVSDKQLAAEIMYEIQTMHVRTKEDSQEEGQDIFTGEKGGSSAQIADGVLRERNSGANEIYVQGKHDSDEGKGNQIASPQNYPEIITI